MLMLSMHVHRNAAAAEHASTIDSNCQRECGNGVVPVKQQAKQQELTVNVAGKQAQSVMLMLIRMMVEAKI